MDQTRCIIEVHSPHEDLPKNIIRAKKEVSNYHFPPWSLKNLLMLANKAACSFKIDENTQAIHVTHKYYDQADFVLYRINVYSSPPVFIINRSDLTPKLQSNLEQLYKSCPYTFDRLVTDAVQWILESVNKRYYHVSNIAYKVCWRFEP